MSVCVKRNTYITMPHQVLQCLRVHTCFRHITAVSMSAYMRRDIRHLHPVNIIVSANHMIESMLPMHCHKRHSLLIQKKEAAVSIYHFFYFRTWPILDDSPEHICHIICDWQLSCSCIRLG